MRPGDRLRLVTVLVTAVIFTVIVGSYVYDRYFAAAGLGDMSVYTVRGIDISHHNGPEIDFEAVRDAGYSFVYIKATEGTNFKDRHFVNNARRAREAGLRVGAYHFFRFDTDGEMQALNLMHSLRGYTLDLPVAIDVEEWGNPDGEATSRIVTRMRDLFDTMHRGGFDVIIYTNKDGYERFVKGNFDGMPLWISSFTTPPGDIDWDVWQYSHTGTVPGVPGSVDLNVRAE